MIALLRTLLSSCSPREKKAAQRPATLNLSRYAAIVLARRTGVQQERGELEKPTPATISGADSRYTDEGKSERIWWQEPIVLNVKQAGGLRLSPKVALGKL